MRIEMTAEPDANPLLQDLRGLSTRIDPVPDDLTDAATAAFSSRTVDKDLARLTFDSLLDQSPPVGARGSGAPRRLTFVSPGLTVELDVGDDGLAGRLLPPGPADIEVRWPGDSTSVHVDAQGNFSLPTVPRGPVSLSCRRRSPDAGPPVVTDWITL